MGFFKKTKKEPTVETVHNSDWQELLSAEEDEGQLAIDVYQKDGNFVIRSTIAGAKPEDIEITVNGEMLTISGSRNIDEAVNYQDFLYRECYWGKFSRTIILPSAIKEDEVEADMEDGVLTVLVPKADKSSKTIKIRS